MASASSIECETAEPDGKQHADALDEDARHLGDVLRPPEGDRELGDRLELAVARRDPLLRFERPADAADDERAVAPAKEDEPGRQHCDGSRAERDVHVAAESAAVVQDEARQDRRGRRDAREDDRDRPVEGMRPRPLPPAGPDQGHRDGRVRSRDQQERHGVEEDRFRRLAHRPANRTPPRPVADPGNPSDGGERGYDGGVVRKVLLASPRGYCAGVERAVETVEKAIELYGTPVYVRKQIVHNLHVVRDLEARGAIFVDEETEVPEGKTVVFSAHGVAPTVHANAAIRRLNTIDATCPLVTKVHVQARRYAASGYTVLLIGHAGHEEVVGTLGESARLDRARGVGREVAPLAFPPGRRLAYVTQTTLSVDETHEIITALRARFPHIHAPKKEDICYATSNRQWAVKEMLAEVDLLLVIGSHNSSNSNRLVEVARAGGVESYLIEDETEIDDTWLDGVEIVGITSGASAPEKLVIRVCDWFRERGVTDIEPYRMVDEDVEFRLPVELRRELALADAQCALFSLRRCGGVASPGSVGQRSAL